MVVARLASQTEPFNYFQYPYNGTTGAEALPEFPVIARPEEYNELPSLWLVHMAKLVYESKAKVTAELKNAGFKSVVFLDSGSTQGFAAIGYQSPKGGDFQNIAIVSFRGTEADYLDILTNASFTQRKFEGNAAKGVHGGFLTGVEEIWGTPSHHLGLDYGQDIDVDWKGAEGLAEVLEGIHESHDLYFTGHSLGGALALVAALHAEHYGLGGRIKGIYTVGQPKVMGKAFSKKFFETPNLHKRFFRIVNRGDIVPRVPMSVMGYGHNANDLVFLQLSSRSGSYRAESNSFTKFRIATIVQVVLLLSLIWSFAEISFWLWGLAGDSIVSAKTWWAGFIADLGLGLTALNWLLTNIADVLLIGLLLMFAKTLATGFIKFFQFRGNGLTIFYNHLSTEYVRKLEHDAKLPAKKSGT